MQPPGLNRQGLAHCVEGAELRCDTQLVGITKCCKRSPIRQNPIPSHHLPAPHHSYRPGKTSRNGHHTYARTRAVLLLKGMNISQDFAEFHGAPPGRLYINITAGCGRHRARNDAVCRSGQRFQTKMGRPIGRPLLSEGIGARIVPIFGGVRALYSARITDQTGRGS